MRMIPAALVLIPADESAEAGGTPFPSGRNRIPQNHFAKLDGLGASGLNG